MRRSYTTAARASLPARCRRSRLRSGGALTALLIGLLVGLDRERAQRGHPVVFAGIRTFPLFALCGYLGALGTEHGLPSPLPVVLLAVVALGVASFVMYPAEGATTEVAALLTALLGALVAWNQAPLAARGAQVHLGTAGLWTVGLVGGLVDVDSVAVAAAHLRQQGTVDVEVAASTYLFATLSNLLFKGATVVVAGGRPLARQVLPAFLLLAALTTVIVVLR